MWSSSLVPLNWTEVLLGILQSLQAIPGAVAWNEQWNFPFHIIIYSPLIALVVVYRVRIAHLNSLRMWRRDGVEIQLRTSRNSLPDGTVVSFTLRPLYIPGWSSISTMWLGDSAPLTHISIYRPTVCFVCITESYGNVAWDYSICRSL